jgi:hypothetical protein
MAATTPDHIVATLNRRARQTVVDIAMTPKACCGETDHIQSKHKTKMAG